MTSLSRLRIAFVHPDLGIGKVSSNLQCSTIEHSFTDRWGRKAGGRCSSRSTITRTHRRYLHLAPRPEPLFRRNSRRYPPRTPHRLTLSARMARKIPHPVCARTPAPPHLDTVSLQFCRNPTRRLLCRPTLNMYTPPPDVQRKTRPLLLSFPRQVARTWSLGRRRVSEEKRWRTQSVLSLPHGLARGDHDTYVLSSYFKGPGLLTPVFSGQADTLVANSKFTARITMAHLSSITSTPKVVYPGINVTAYQAPVDWTAPDTVQITS